MSLDIDIKINMINKSTENNIVFQIDSLALQKGTKSLFDRELTASEIERIERSFKEQTDVVDNFISTVLAYTFPTEIELDIRCFGCGAKKNNKTEDAYKILANKISDEIGYGKLTTEELGIISSEILNSDLYNIDKHTISNIIKLTLKDTRMSTIEY